MESLSVPILTVLGFGGLFPKRIISFDQLACNHDILDLTRVLSSSIEYLSTRMYNSSIVVSGSKDSDWKKGVDGAKLLLNFWRIASMLYDSICGTACPNLLVKSWIDSSSYLRMVWKELTFLFCCTKQRYCDMNVAHRSYDEFIE